MALSPEILRAELVDVRRRLEETQRDWEEVQDRLRKLQNQQQALAVLLDGREEVAQLQVSRPQIPEAPVREVREGLFETSGADAEVGTNKTEVIRQIIREHGLNGASPVDVWQGIQNRKITMHRNYVYAVLARLTEKNELKQHDGRYILAQVQ